MNDILKKNIEVSFLKKAEKAIRDFTAGEKALLVIFIAVFLLSGVLIVLNLSNRFSITVPSRGGELSEGILGGPRFINPVLATSDADKDLSALLFAGLLKPAADGSYLPDLAENFEVSEDGLTYKAVLKSNAVFHDGEPITADDVIFTVEKTTDPAIKSPRRAQWEGVIVEKFDNRTVIFKLTKPYYPFIENLTLGIIPKHIWKDVSAEEFTFSLENISPIGSGPFKITNLEKGKNGIPTAYLLSSFKKYAGDRPFIKTLTVKIFPAEKDLISALENGKVDNVGGISSQKAKELSAKGYETKQLPLPKIFGVFLNQNQLPIFADKEVRQALNKSAPRADIVEKILAGYASPLYGPIPEMMFSDYPTNIASTSIATSSSQAIYDARKILEKAGWVLDQETNVYKKTTKTKSGKTEKTLEFSLASPNVEELKAVAELLKTTWEMLGAKVDLKLFEPSELRQNIIRPRKFDALLFGEGLNINPDLYSFWHSSQRNDPGYNIALYANTKVDKWLDEARSAKNRKDQEAANKKIYDEINNDLPVIFLYSTDYIYLTGKKIGGFEIGAIANPSERFADISKWHLKTDRVWEIFENFLQKI